MYIHPFSFRFLSHIDCHRILDRIPCAIQQLPVGQSFHIPPCAIAATITIKVSIISQKIIRKKGKTKSIVPFQKKKNKKNQLVQTENVGSELVRMGGKWDSEKSEIIWGQFSSL